MGLDCQRWIELSDREAIGEPLTDAAREFQRSHLATCSSCRQEASLWRSLKPQTGELLDEGEIDTILKLALATPSPKLRQGRGPGKPVTAVAVTAFACAAAAALWFGLRPSERAASRDEPSLAAQGSTQIPSPPPAEVTARTAALPSKPSCDEIVPGITACLGADSALATKSLEGTNRAIALARGRVVVSLLPQPPGTTFSVTTPAGKVTAVGTIFSVEIDSDGRSVVRVVHGRVVVFAASRGGSRALSAGEALRIGGDEPTRFAPGEVEQDLALLPPGHVERETSKDSRDSASSASRARASSQEELLAQAQSLRARGEFRQAADLYRKVSELNPKSASGSIALVSLGELSLSSLKDAQGALNAFNAYLSRGGPLSQEALFGKARALRALERESEERRTVEQFLATYPDAPQSRVLRRRLAELE